MFIWKKGEITASGPFSGLQFSDDNDNTFVSKYRIQSIVNSYIERQAYNT